MHPFLRKRLSVLRVAEQIDELLLKHELRLESSIDPELGDFHHVKEADQYHLDAFLQPESHVLEQQEDPEVFRSLCVVLSGRGSPTFQVQFSHKDAVVEDASRGGPLTEPLVDVLFDMIGKRFYHSDQALTHEQGMKLVEAMILRVKDIESKK
jgi:hypothetical protein